MLREKHKITTNDSSSIHTKLNYHFLSYWLFTCTNTPLRQLFSIVKMPIEYTPVDYEASYANSLVLKHSVNVFKESFNLYGKVKCFLPIHYLKYADQIENFTVKEDDVWVVTYPKSGTTWAQEMVWLLGNNLDYEGAKLELEARFPFLEFSSIFEMELFTKGNPQAKKMFFNTVEVANQMPSPRFIKSHLHHELLPKQLREGIVKSKIIYIARDPRDVCVSFYHHNALLEGYTGTMNEFCEMFLDDKVIFSPYWAHLSDFWKRRNDPNVLYLTYEQMKFDLPSVIMKTATFLEKKLNDEDVEKLCRHLSFRSMKNNPAVNVEKYIKHRREKGEITEEAAFIRKGQVGSYKEELKEEYVKKLEDWIDTNLKTYGLPRECF